MLLCSAEEIKAAETNAEALGISPSVLMDSAARALLDAVLSDAPKSAESLVVLCGAGNNGADGYTLAALAREQGLRVSVISVFPPSSPLCRERAYSCNTLSSPLFSYEGSDRVLCNSLIEKADVIVDCVFGIGYDTARTPDPAFLSLCHALRDTKAFIISADVPSGLDPDTGAFWHEGERAALIFADLTVTFSASKIALETPPGIHAAGKVKIADVGIPDECFSATENSALLLDKSIKALLKPRENDTSKANYGKLLAYCGSSDMPGAGVLSATGALRCGIGLLTCFSEKSALSQIQSRFAEPIFFPIPETIENETDLPRTRDLLTRRLVSQTAVLVGCGIGTGKEQEALLETVLTETVCPVVCDADALTLLASREDLLSAYGEKLILTPHPGEMGRLCHTTPAEVQMDRIQKAKALSEKYGSVVVLKGFRTVIAAPDGRLAVCRDGNPGMAKAGMGDLLAGMIASLAAQKLSAFDAACLGVYLHARAGDLCRAELGEVSMLPSDVAAFLPQAITE